MDHTALADIIAQAVKAALTVQPRPEPDFHTLAGEWLAEVRHRPSWRREIERLLGKELAGLVRPGRDEVGGLLRGIRAPSVHNHCLAIVGGVYRWGMATGRCQANPAYGFRRRPLAPRTRVLSVEELRQVAGAGPLPRLLVLTGARIGEAGGLAWVEVEADRLSLPASRVKNKLPRLIPAPAQVLGCLPKRRPGYPFCWGRTRATGFQGWSKLKREAPALGAPWTWHDIRRGCATAWVEELGADADLVEVALGHVRPGVSGVYNRSVRWPDRVSLAGRWAQILAL